MNWVGMMSLLERCAHVQQVVQDAEEAKRSLHVRLQVTTRTKEWSAKRQALDRARDRANWVALGPERLSAYREFNSKLKAAAAEVLARIETVEQMPALTEDPLWLRLLSSADAATEALDAAIEQAWSDFIEDLGTLDDPEKLAATLASTPANQSVVRAYSEPFATYKNLTQQKRPNCADDRESLRCSVAKCRDILKRVERDLPAEVEEFFRALDSNTATLSIVTPEVLNWLRKNGQLDQYRIRIATR